jgi:hypothetical protein
MMAARSSKCKACVARTTASAGYCQRCKSLRHHGYKRVKDENLIVDQVGGAWWIWDARGNVLVAGKPTHAEAIIALAVGEDDNDDAAEEFSAHSTKKSAAQLQGEIDEALRARKEHASDLAAGVLHGERRGRARDFRTDKATQKQIPDAVRTAIAAGALEFIEGSYRRHALVGGKEPCVTVGLVADYLRQAHMPEDFRWAPKERQRTWTRSVLESMRRSGQIGSSFGDVARCYEPKR